MKYIFGLVILSSFFWSCSNKIDKVERGFYYWKTNHHINREDDTILSKTNIQKLYVKFFEIEHNELMGNVPFAKNRLRLYNVKQQIIPTIFIKNEVFEKSNQKDLEVLADNVNFLIAKFLKEENESLKVNEFQMDCDWTIKTKENYFYFLEKIKEISKKEISCTLRLYPYKYQTKMGVPPVDKVTLMCYNLLNPLENHKQNSILDNDELAKYLNISNKYPLHIDVALPVYSWMQLYQNNQFQGVLYEDHQYILEKLKKIDDMWYEVQDDFKYNGHYLRIGDKIKYEKTDKRTIQKAIKLLKNKVNFDDNVTVTLFHLDEEHLEQFSYEEINSFYTDFSK